MLRGTVASVSEAPHPRVLFEDVPDDVFSELAPLVGTAKQIFTVTSGNEVYWKSTDCQTAPVDTVVLLEPGKTLTSNRIAWDRTRSDPSTCVDKARQAAPAAGASYHLKVQVNGVTSKTTKQFLLN